MIDLYSGTPGSGKSLHAAMTIYWHLRCKKPVVTNFPFTMPEKYGNTGLVQMDNTSITVDKLISISTDYFSTHRFSEDAILLVVDEAQLVYNARDWQARGRNDWLSFFSQHRKLGYHIILIAQYDRMIDKQIRSMVEYQYIHRRVSNFGIGGKALSLISGGKLYVAVKIWYPLNERIGSDFFRARSKYYQLYNSYARLD